MSGVLATLGLKLVVEAAQHCLNKVDMKLGMADLFLLSLGCEYEHSLDVPQGNGCLAGAQPTWDVRL